MGRADLAKFAQHAELAELLLDGRGSNWAGRVLMEVREKLRGTPSGEKHTG